MWSYFLSTVYRWLLYVLYWQVADDEPTYLDDTPAMIVMIIVAVLFFFIILFVIIAAWCIRKSKQKSKKDLGKICRQ